MRLRLLRIMGLVVVFAAAGTTPAAAVKGVPAWPAASELTLPSGADRAKGGQTAALDSVACTSPGSCVAVGAYSDTARSSQAMVAAETSGVWGRASELTLPSGANATAGDQHAGVDSVACTGSGSCVAVGNYTDANGSQQAMVASETDGVWAQASELVLPSGANATAGDQDASLDSVACTGPGSCVAVGSYADSNGTKDQQAMLATETSGAWGQASELTLPSGANATAGGQHAILQSVACTGSGDCVAVGSYADTAKSAQALVATETSGVWGQASELALPTNALGVGPLYPPGAQCNRATCSQAASLDSVACTSLGNCVAVGDYLDDSLQCDEVSTDDCGALDEAMVATETSGVWAQAANVGASNTGIELSALDSVACTGPGSCVAVGQQTSITPFMGGATYADYPAMLAAETGGAWGHVSAATLPSGAAPVQEPPSGTPTPGGPVGPEENARLDSVACASPGSCVAVGYYLDTNESTQAMVLSSVASLAVIAKHTVSSRRHSATFSFTAEGEASGFQCALVRVARAKHSKHNELPAPRYARCRTPKRYTKLTPGSYVFYVRTVGAGADKTPASRRFTIG